MLYRIQYFQNIVILRYINTYRTSLNVTDMKEKETNEERQTRLVNLYRYLHISVMALHIDWLGEE